MRGDTGWFKSTFSIHGNDACVEVRIAPTSVGVRDSKNAAAGALRIRPDAWKSFVAQVNQDQITF